MDNTHNFRLWIFALILVALQYLLSDEGRRSVSSGLWHTCMTLCIVGSVFSAWPYTRDNFLRIWHGDAEVWPITVLVVGVLAVAAMTWIATYSHVSSHGADAKGLTTTSKYEQQIREMQKTLDASNELAESRLASALQAEHTLSEQTDRHRLELGAAKKNLRQAVADKDSVSKQLADARKERTESQEREEESTHALNEATVKIESLREELNKKKDDSERLREAKEQIQKKVDQAPTHDEFTPENATAWIDSSQMLVKSIAWGKSHDFYSPNSSPMSLRDYQTSVESLRAIALTLKISDLAD